MFCMLSLNSKNIPTKYIRTVLHYSPCVCVDMLAKPFVCLPLTEFFEQFVLRVMKRQTDY